MNDAALLAQVPDFIRIGGIFKATPAEESGERFLYIEASNEDPDHQNEIVLQKALAASADYYLRHGNVDIAHYSLLGPARIPNHLEYEIGRPAEVRVDGRTTFVKALLYQGESPQARNASLVWDSLTRQTPPMRWYPSVGGSVLSKSVRFDPETRQNVVVVDQVRWSNTALDRCPVNKTVPEVSTVPVGVFAKSLGGFVVAKALDAGHYGTDVAALTGGAALATQSLDRKIHGYWDFADRFGKDLRSGRARIQGGSSRIRALVEYVTARYGVEEDEAAEWVGRYLEDLSAEKQRR